MKLDIQPVMEFYDYRIRIVLQILLIGLLAAALATPLAARFQSETPANPAFSDNDLLESAERELETLDMINPDYVNMQVDAGVITLTGMTENLFAKHQVGRVLSSLRGVRAVSNQLKVVPMRPVDDSRIRTVIQSLFRHDEVVEAHEVSFDVKDGKVKLEGTVDSMEEKLIAESVASRASGVLEIENRIRIQTTANRSNREIQAEIQRRMALSPFVAEAMVKVEVKDGNVSLWGTVGSVGEKRLLHAFSHVAGVKNVDSSELQIDPDRKSERRRDKFASPKSDTEIVQAVRDALLYNPRVKRQKISVNAKLAAVTLQGNVSSLAASRSAEQTALNTIGVRRVNNLLKVKPKQDWPGDTVITKSIREAIASDPRLSSQKIGADSHFAKVYLTGTVRTLPDKNRAEDVVANVANVTRIVNLLKVEGEWVPKSDDDILEDTRRRFRWSPVFELQSIKAQADDGVVTLRGEVDSYNEKRAAEREAMLAGARRVRNQVQVRTGDQATIHQP